MNKVFRKKKAADFLIALLEYSIIVMIMMHIGSVWLRMQQGFLAGKVGIVNNLTSFFIVLLAVLFGVKNGFFTLKNQLFWAIVCIFSIALTLYGNFSSLARATTTLYLPVLSSLLLATFMRIDDFSELIGRFIRCMLIVAVVSLFFWTFGSILHWLPNSGKVTFVWDHVMSATSYYGVYFEPAWQKLVIPGYGVLQKNCGIFTETPMYCFLLSTAYCWYRIQPEQKMWVRVIFLATIATAINTTAITAVIIFEVVKYALENNVRGRKDVFKFIVLPLLGLVGFYAVYALVIAKLDTGSGNIRMDHLISCVNAFLSSFPFGTGVESHSYIVGLGEYEQGISVGLPYLFAQGGLGAVLLIFVPSVYLFLKAFKTKSWGVIAFLAAFLWSLFCTSMVYRCHLYWILICYFVNYGTMLSSSNGTIPQ